eukprot:gene3630-13714_t
MPIIFDMPAGASVRELKFVGNGACAKVLERAHLRTVGDLIACNLDNVTENGPMKRVWAAIDSCKDDQSWREIRDWFRVGRTAYYAILRVKESEPSPDIPAPFQCSISHDWIQYPVITVPAGQSYERVNIEHWIATAPRDANNCVADPITRIPISAVVANVALKAAIARYRPLEERFLITTD